MLPDFGTFPRLPRRARKPRVNESRSRPLWDQSADSLASPEDHESGSTAFWSERRCAAMGDSFILVELSHGAQYFLEDKNRFKDKMLW